MDESALSDLDRVPHGGTTDPQLLDFSAPSNPVAPTGIAGVYESALSAARRYPGDDYVEFRTAAADFLDCEPFDVVPVPWGVGGIRLAFEALVGTDDAVLLPEPTFGEFEREARAQGADVAFAPARDVLEADPAAHDVVVVANPNNPLGLGYEPARLHAFVERCRDAGTIVLLDEAYHGFTGEPSFAGTPGVVVIRSLSCLFGLPGLLTGFVVATDELRDRLDAGRPCFAMSTPAAMVGEYCLRQEEFVERTRERVARERTRMRERLTERFEVPESVASFLTCRVDDVQRVLDEARRAGIALRDATTFRGLDSHVRITVRREHENDQLLEALGV